MIEYPIVELTTQGVEVVPHTGVDLESLSDQLEPVRDALSRLFEAGRGKSAGTLQRLEVELSLTHDGRVAFATGNTSAFLKLTFERKPSASRTRTTKPKPAAVTEPEAPDLTEPKQAEVADPERAEIPEPDLVTVR